jgi:cytochrome c biogenesis protein CcmG, thiol:disulfide interchange protein DsbE
MFSAGFLKRIFFILLALLMLTVATIGLAMVDGRTTPRDMVERINPIHIGPSQDTELNDRGPVPPFVLEGLSDSDLRGEARLVVLFASWCAPCRAEHPVIMNLSKSVPVYGIDVTDQPGGLEAYLKKGGNPYRKIGIDDTGEVGIAWGATGLPTSFIVNAEGRIVWRHDGPMSAEVANNVVLPLMKKLQ